MNRFLTAAAGRLARMGSERGMRAARRAMSLAMKGARTQRYDPRQAPDPQAWLAIDEGERIRRVQRSHMASRQKLPNPRVHAVVHVIVENQIAEGFDPTVRALDRLQREGLSRHDAIHAVGSVLAEHLFGAPGASKTPSPEQVQRRLVASIEQLTASKWKGTGQ